MPTAVARGDGATVAPPMGVQEDKADPAESKAEDDGDGEEVHRVCP
jgi:hypothetical protein